MKATGAGYGAASLSRSARRSSSARETSLSARSAARGVGLGGAGGLAGAVEQVGVGGVERGVVRPACRCPQQRLEDRQARVRPGGAADRDGAVDLHHRRGRLARELAVEPAICCVVGVGGGPGVRVDARDRRLELVGPGAAPAQRVLEQRLALADAAAIPAGAVLLVERHELTVLVHAGRAPRVVQQHQRQQPRHLGIVGHQAVQQPARGGSPRRTARSRTSRSPPEAAQPSLKIR